MIQVINKLLDLHFGFFLKLCLILSFVGLTTVIQNLIEIDHEYPETYKYYVYREFSFY
jgi:hypothetical protein